MFVTVTSAVHSIVLDLSTASCFQSSGRTDGGAATTSGLLACFPFTDLTQLRHEAYRVVGIMKVSLIRLWSIRSIIGTGMASDGFFLRSSPCLGTFLTSCDGLCA